MASPRGSVRQTPLLSRGGVARSAGVVLAKKWILLTNTTPVEASPRLSPPRLRRGVCTRALLLALLAFPMFVLAQTPAYRAPRTPDGKPDLNGIWQALNEANYDIEMHGARPAMAVRPGPYGPVPDASVLALGAVGAVPPGVGIVEGGDLPYKPE